jgi:hypothetical protein
MHQVYFNESKESMVKVNKRIRSKLQETKTILIIEPKDGLEESYEIVKKAFMAQSLDSIELVETPKVVTSSKKLGKGKICAHELVRSRNAARFDYDNNFVKETNDYRIEKLSDQTILYVDMHGNSFDKSYSKEDLFELSEYLEVRGIRLVGLSKENAKKIEGLKNFIPLGKWLIEYKPNTHDIKNAKHTFKSPEGDKLIDFNEELKGHKDSFITKVAKEYKPLKGCRILPNLLLNEVKELKEVKDFAELDEKASGYIEENYPLVDEISSYGWYSISSKVKKDLVFYINAKNKGVK